MKAELVERTAQGLHASLIQLLPTIASSAPILDLGCGTGAWLDRLGQHGFTNLRGIDFDTSCFNTAYATPLQKNLNCDDLGFTEESFALITAIEIIEHLEYPGRLFQIASKYLQNSGYFLLTTPNIHSVRCRLRFFLKGKLSHFDEHGNEEHITPVYLDSLNRILQRYNLSIVKQWSYSSNSYLSSFNPLLNTLIELAKRYIPAPIEGEIVCFLIQKNSSIHSV